MFLKDRHVRIQIRNRWLGTLDPQTLDPQVCSYPRHLIPELLPVNVINPPGEYRSRSKIGGPSTLENECWDT